MSGADPSEPAPADPSHGDIPEEVFLEFLGRREGRDFVDPADLDDLCRRHPHIEPDLRDLAAQWRLAVHLRLIALAHEPDADHASASRPPAIAGILARLSSQATPDERYRDGGELGRGAQGVVRRAFDATLQRHIAMKVPLDAGESVIASAPGSSRRLGRFVEEAQITAQLDHPAVVPVHDLGLDSRGDLYFTMKLVSGRSLHDVLAARARAEGGEWTTTRLVSALARVAEAMNFAHDRGVVHRDLKPANVMLGDYGEVYVMDWGLARVVDADRGERTLPSAHDASPIAPASGVQTHRREIARDAPQSSLLSLEGDIVGTPPYMAPEQASGQVAAVGPLADVYALGAMIYHVLAGRPPYTTRPGASPEEQLEAVLHQVPVPLDQAAKDVPAELAAVCERAMARDPATRYPSMKELAADLRAYLEVRVVRAYEGGPLAELRKWVRRNRVLTSVAAAALLAVIGGLLTISRIQVRAREDADRRLAEVMQLSDVQQLEWLRRRADALWPAVPGRVAAMREWTAAAHELLERTPVHRATLAALRARAEPYTDDDARADRDSFQYAALLASEQVAVRGLRALQDAPDPVDADPNRREVIRRKLKMAEDGIARMEVERDARRTWRFQAKEDAWWHQSLAELLAALDRFAEFTLPGVERRLARALDLERVSLIEPASQWSEAIESIADPQRCPLYGGLRITPQLGLAPIGRNPRTGLWEFRDVQLGGESPERREDGSLVIKPETAVVMVLLPGGTFRFGAQRDDPAAPNYDPWRDPAFCRVQEVRLDPFFMGAHEVTQAQWQRAMGNNPSLYQAPTFTGGNEYTETNPVESMTRGEAGAMAARYAFALPTEAQWEYACRAGTSTIWWTGNDVASLAGAANIADAWLNSHTAGDWSHERGLDDGHGGHAPAGTYRANPFGLHEMIGNVSEWMRDPWAEPPPDAAPGDGSQTGGNPEMVCGRGGGWSSELSATTSATRERLQVGLRADEVGLRLARPLQP